MKFAWNRIDVRRIAAHHSSIANGCLHARIVQAIEEPKTPGGYAAGSEPPGLPVVLFLTGYRGDGR
jgi:hypothetical protein